jgi:hypothetical protein
MERNRRRMLTGLAVTGVLAGALAGGGVALAGTSGAAQPASVAAAVAPAAGTATSTAGTSTAGTATKGHGGVRYLRRHHGARLVLRTSAAYLGLTPAELRTQLEAGKSLSAVASARGKSVSGLENAIVAAVTKRVDASKLTDARKAAVITDVKDNVNAFVTATHPFEKAAHRLGKAAAAAASPTAAGSTAQAAA